MQFREDYDKRAEQVVIGKMLTGEEDRIKAVIEVIDDVEKFYIEGHKKIYKAMLKLYKESKKINILSVKEELEKTGEFEEIGGLEYLVDLEEISETEKDNKFKDYIESIKNRPTKI